MQKHITALGIVLLSLGWFNLGIFSVAYADTEKHIYDKRILAIDAYANQEYSLAKHLFKELADNGDMISQYGLAKIYRFGYTETIDYALAKKYYLLAAKQGYGVAHSHIGEIYENGLGVKVNLPKAKQWYQSACENNCTEGCRHLQRLKANEWSE